MIDPRIKLILLVAFIAGLSFWHARIELRFGCALLVLCCIALVSRAPVVPVLRNALLVLPVAGIFAFLLWASGDGTRAISIVEKTYLSATAVALTTATTTVPELSEAAACLRIPRLLTEIVMFIVRYMRVLRAEAASIQTAMRCRGTRRSGLLPSAGGVAVLFARSLEKSDRLFQAMVSRGYSGRLPSRDLQALRVKDYAALALGLVAIITAGWTV